MSVNKLLQIGVSVLLLSVIVLRTDADDWRHVVEAFANLRVELWLTALAVLLIAQVASAGRWKIFARTLRFERSLPQFTGFYFIGMYFNLVLPTSVGGDVVRAWYLDGRSGRRMAAFASVFLDRLSGLLVLLAMAGLGVLLSPLAVPAWICWTVAGLCVGAVVGLAAMILLVDRVPYARRYAQQVKTVLAAFREPRVLFATTLLSTIVQVASVSLTWLVGMALNLPIPASFYWIMVPLVSLLTLLPISVNGMGVREGATAVLLAPFVTDVLAYSLSLLWFAVYVAAGLSGGLVYLFGRFPKPGTPAAEKVSGPFSEDDHGPVGRDSDQGRARQFKAAA
jgi:uncharacterized membrane protein YbhN (UPF0104 family)